MKLWMTYGELKDHWQFSDTLDVLILLGAHGLLVLDDDDQWKPTNKGRVFSQSTPSEIQGEDLTWDTRALEDTLLQHTLSEYVTGHP